MGKVNRYKSDNLRGQRIVTAQEINHATALEVIGVQRPTEHRQHLLHELDPAIVSFHLNLRQILPKSVSVLKEVPPELQPVKNLQRPKKELRVRCE
jgi:hypothetical protein